MFLEGEGYFELVDGWLNNVVFWMYVCMYEDENGIFYFVLILMIEFEDSFIDYEFVNLIGIILMYWDYVEFYFFV